MILLFRLLHEVLRLVFLLPAQRTSALHVDGYYAPNLLLVVPSVVILFLFSHCLYCHA